MLKKSSIQPHLKIIGICYYAILLKEEKKKQKYTTTITLWKRISSNKQNISYVMISVKMFIFKIKNLYWTSQWWKQVINWQKKQQTEKIEKHWKISKIFSIINLKTICYKPTASDELFHSNLNYKFLRRPAFYGYLREWKRQAKTAN